MNPLEDIMTRIGGGLKWGGFVVGIAGAFWTYFNWKDGGGGGAQMTTSIIMMVGGFGAAGLSYLFDSLDTSWAN